MAEHLVPLKKESGGSAFTWHDQEFEWKKDGDVVDVPYELALELLALPSGDFEVADEKKAQKAADEHKVATQDADHGHDHTEGRQVIEPAPGNTVEGRMVTEPGPSPDREISEHPPPPTTQDSPIKPKPRGGTRTAPSSKK